MSAYDCRLNRSTQHFIVEGKIDYRPISQRFRGGTRAAEKITLWDSWLRRDSLKAIGRTFGKPSLLFIAGWPPVLRRSVEITTQSGHDPSGAMAHAPPML